MWKAVLLVMILAAAIWLHRGSVCAWFDGSTSGVPKIDSRLSQAYTEAGLRYYADFNDVDSCRHYLEFAGKDNDLAQTYLSIFEYLQKKEPGKKEKEVLENEVKNARAELEKLDEKSYVYYLPFLSVYDKVDSRQGYKEMIRLCERLLKEESFKEAQKERQEYMLQGYLAKGYEKNQEYVNAIKIYEEIKEKEKDSRSLEEVYLRLSDLYGRQGDLKKSVNICKEAVEKLPGSEKLWIKFLEQNCSAGYVTETEGQEIFDEVQKRFPDIQKNGKFTELKAKYAVEAVTE